MLYDIVTAMEKVSVPAIEPICRDPTDDKFLALAIAGRARVIISGDKDLLSLNPFRGILILSPRDYLME